MTAAHVFKVVRLPHCLSVRDTDKSGYRVKKFPKRGGSDSDEKGAGRGPARLSRTIREQYEQWTTVVALPKLCAFSAAAFHVTALL